jgi:hypothetical protein
VTERVVESGSIDRDGQATPRLRRARAVQSGAVWALGCPQVAPGDLELVRGACDGQCTASLERFSLSFPFNLFLATDSKKKQES